MKHLYMIGGPMGVGKTTVCQALKKQLDKSVFLDGDWCWDMHPFTVTDETKALVMDNIVHLLTGFLSCTEIEHVIFCWVMHEQAIIDDILKKLPLENCQVHRLSLVCSKEALTARLQKDVNAGLRTEDVIEKSLARMPLYEKLSTLRIDTTHMHIDSVVHAIQAAASSHTSSVNLILVGCESAKLIHRMQVEAFSESYEKYGDTETNPAAESLKKVLDRLQQPFTYYYLIQYGGETAGAIRIVDKKDSDSFKRLSPIFILPAYRKQGIGQKAIMLAEQIHGHNHWELETILEEPALCRLYERLGYHKTGKTQKISEQMTLVYYQK